MNEAVRHALGQVFATHGRAVCEDSLKLRAVLAEHCPDYKREIQVLVLAVEHRIPPDLLAGSEENPEEIQARLTRRLVEDVALNEDAARWAVETWAAVLGGEIATPSAVREPPPVRRAPPDDWGVESPSSYPLADLSLHPASSPADFGAGPPSGSPGAGGTWWIAALVYAAILVAVQAGFAWFALALDPADLFLLLPILVGAAVFGFIRSRRDVYQAAARQPDRFAGRSLAFPWAAMMAIYSIAGSLSLYLIVALGLGLGQWLSALAAGTRSWSELLAGVVFVGSAALCVAAVVWRTAGGWLRGVALAWVVVVTAAVVVLLVRYFSEQLQGGPAFELKEFAPLLISPLVLFGAVIWAAWSCLVTRRFPTLIVLGLGIAPAGLLGLLHAGWWHQFPVAGPNLTLTGHGGQVESVAFSPDGTRLVSGGLPGKNGEVKVWDARGGKMLQNLTGHEHWVNAVAFSPDGRHIASGGGKLLGDGEVILWDAVTGKQLVQRTARGADGKALARVAGLAYSPDGNRLVTIDSGRGGTGTVWDMTRFTDRSKAADVTVLRPEKDRQELEAVAFSPDGEKVVTAGSGANDSGQIVVWDARTGEAVRTITDASGTVDSVGFSPDGTRLVSGGKGGIKVWSLATGQASVDGRVAGWVLRTAFSPDGKRVAAGTSKGMVTLWDAATGRELLTFCAHHGNVRSLAFSPDGKQLATGGQLPTIKVWNLPGE